MITKQIKKHKWGIKYKETAAITKLSRGRFIYQILWNQKLVSSYKHKYTYRRDILRTFEYVAMETKDIEHTHLDGRWCYIFKTSRKFKLWWKLKT